MSNNIIDPRFFRLYIKKNGNIIKSINIFGKVEFDTGYWLVNINNPFMKTKVKIYGLKYYTMNALLFNSWTYINSATTLPINQNNPKDNFTISISAGYNRNSSKGNTSSNFFINNHAIMSAYINNSTPDNTYIELTTIYATEKMQKTINESITLSYNGANSNVDEMLAQLASENGLVYSGYDTLKNIFCSNYVKTDSIINIVLDIQKMLNGFMPDKYNFIIKVEKNVLKVYNYINIDSKKTIRYISGTSNMIGHPSPDSGFGVNVDVTLDTSYKNEDIVKLSSYKINFNEDILFKVLDVRHQGQTQGSLWRTTLRLVPVSAVARQNYNITKKEGHTI